MINAIKVLIYFISLSSHKLRLSKQVAHLSEVDNVAYLSVATIQLPS